MFLLHHVHVGTHMHSLEELYIQLYSYTNKLISNKVLDNVIHYLNSHTTFNYNMQTRDTTEYTAPVHFHFSSSTAPTSVLYMCYPEILVRIYSYRFAFHTSYIPLYFIFHASILTL
jgi:hypothetical protein